jgi:hypothetical protein
VTARWLGLTPPKSLHRAACAWVSLAGVVELEAGVVELEAGVVELEAGVVELELPQPAIRIVAVAIRTPLNA